MSGNLLDARRRRIDKLETHSLRQLLLLWRLKFGRPSRSEELFALQRNYVTNSLRMARQGTSDINAEKAVVELKTRMLKAGRTMSQAWLTVAELLFTCEVWDREGWQVLHKQPVLRERNDYKIAV